MDLERLDEAIEFLDGWDIDAAWVDEAHAALRAYRDLLANGVEPDYAAGLNLLLAKWWEDESDLAVFTEAVDAAIGDRLLVDHPKEGT